MHHDSCVATHLVANNVVIDYIQLDTSLILSTQRLDLLIDIEMDLFILLDFINSYKSNTCVLLQQIDKF